MNMAAENVKAFFEALSKDEAIQQALNDSWHISYIDTKLHACRLKTAI